MEKRMEAKMRREGTKGNRNDNIYELAELIVIMNWLESPLYRKVVWFL